jgi:hypothetical protein
MQETHERDPQTSKKMQRLDYKMHPWAWKMVILDENPTQNIQIHGFHEHKPQV